MKFNQSTHNYLKVICRLTQDSFTPSTMIETGLGQKAKQAILADLRKAGLVTSEAGTYGGYKLTKPLWEISLYEVVSVVKGPIGQQSDDPADKLLFDIEQRIEAMLKKTYIWHDSPSERQ